MADRAPAAWSVRIPVRARVAALAETLTSADHWPLLLPEGIVAEDVPPHVGPGAQFRVRVGRPFAEAGDAAGLARFGAVEPEAAGVSLRIDAGLSSGPLMLRWTAASVPDDASRSRGVLTVTGASPTLSEFEFQQYATRALYGLAALSEGPGLWKTTARGFDPKPLHGTFGGGMPPPRRTIRLAPDYGRGYPLWETSTETWDVGTATDPQTYSLSAALASRLAAWQQTWEREFHYECDSDPEVAARWHAEGEELARLLAAEVADYADIEYTRLDI